MSGWLPNIPCIFPAGVPAASSLAVGVGHIRTAPPSVVPRFVPTVFPTPLTCGLSCPVGVGHICGVPLACVSASGQNFTNLSSETLLPVSGFSFSLLVELRSMWSLAVAVGIILRGDDPDAVASVRGIDGASWNNKWDGAVSDAFQVRKAALEAQRLVNKTSHILANDPSRPYVFNKGSHDRPEISVIFCASLLPGCGPRLTGEPAADEVNSSKSICVDGSDVVVDRRVGPVFLKDGLAERLSLAEGNCPKSSRCFESEAEASDAAEEVEDVEVFF